MSNKLLILGAGGYGAMVKEIAAALGCYSQIDFLDDSFGSGRTADVFCESSIGKLDAASAFLDRYNYAIVAIGNPDVRKRYTEQLKSDGYRIATLISSQAYVSPSAVLKEGSVIEPLACVHSHAEVGEGTFVSSGAVVNHNSAVGNYCHVDCNAVVMTGTVVPDGTLLPAGEILRTNPAT